MTYYVGVLDGGGEVWGVRIPDIPGCVGGGETPEAAIADAAEALRDVVVHKREGGFPTPRPSTLSEIVASREIGEGESAVMIPLLPNSRPDSARQHQPRRGPARRDRRHRQGARPQPLGLSRQRGAGEDHGGSVRRAITRWTRRQPERALSLTRSRASRHEAIAPAPGGGPCSSSARR